MQDYIAIGTGPDGQPLVIVAGGNDLGEVRKAAEKHVAAHPSETVSVYQKGQTVAIVCEAKWQ